MHDNNPFFKLSYEFALEKLGDNFYDAVQPADFPNYLLRFRNDNLLFLLGLVPERVSDHHFIEAFGKFRKCPANRPFSQSSSQSFSHLSQTNPNKQTGLALRYHGYQFGQYNPYLGDGRGFLYGQVRSVTNTLMDLGTKGSGTTPYSQGRDGRMTLLGGIREVLAAEALHQLGIPTARTLSLVETDERLERADEPGPARSAVMVRLSQSLIRFGTFERLEYFDRPDLIRKLLDYAIAHYYSHLWPFPDRDIQFYAELVQRTAHLVAQWMAAGFCHGVLNTDNMSIVGEGFDYGPYAFIETYSPCFTAASFDREGRYSYRNQPSVCRWNLERLQHPLALVIPKADMEDVLVSFTAIYDQAYYQAMIQKLGFQHLPAQDADALIQLTLELLLITQIGYHQFFKTLKQQFCPQWREDLTLIFADVSVFSSLQQKSVSSSDLDRALKPWKGLYHRLLRQQPAAEMAAMAQRLKQYNPETTLLQPAIRALWQAIEQTDNWQPFSQTITNLEANALTSFI
ncbi:MAG: YdiU family protein [Cyanobacteria bacterium J06560_5]